MNTCTKYMSCLQCKRKNVQIACQYCRTATYCSESCGKRHWAASHKTECIGKDPSKAMLTLEDLVERLENIPDPSDEEIKKMSKHAWHEDLYIRTATYNVLLSQREEVHRQIIIENFIGDYMVQRGAHPNIVKTLQSELRGIQEDLVNLTMDMVEARPDTPKDIGEINKRVERATNVFLTELGGSPLSFEKDDEREAFQAVAVELSVAYANAMAPIVEIDLVKNDEITRAYGLEPNPMYEGTDAEIQSRIDAGAIPAPPYWNERFDFFVNALEYGPVHEFIGMRGRLRGQQQRGEGPPKPQANLRDYATGNAMGDTRPNADCRTRTHEAHNAWYNVMVQLPGEMWARVKEVARVLTSKDSVEVFTALATSLFIVCKLTNGYYYIMNGDPEVIPRFKDAIRDHTLDVERAKASADLARVYLDRDEIGRNILVNYLKEHKDVKLHIVPIMERFQAVQQQLNNATLTFGGQCLPEDLPGWDALHNAQRLAYAYMKFRLDANTRPGDIPLSSWMRRRMEAARDQMTIPNPSPEQIQNFLEVAGDMTSGMVAVTAEGTVETVQESYNTILRVADNEQRESADHYRKTYDNVDRVAKSNEAVVAASGEIIELGESTRYMTALQKLLAKLKPSEGTYFTLMYVAAALGFSESFVTTFNIMDNPASRAYMERIVAGGSTHFFEYALNSPATFSRMGMFFISNAWSLGWLFSAIGKLEHYASEPARQWLHRNLQRAMKNKRWNVGSVNMAEVFYNATTGIILTGPRYVQAFALHGVVFGIGMVFASYTYNTFPLMMHLASVGALLRNVPSAPGVIWQYTGLPAIRGMADAIIGMAQFGVGLARVIVRPDRFDPFSWLTGGVGLATNVLGATNAAFGVISASFNTFVMYETLRGFRNPFRIHTTLASDEANTSYQELQTQAIASRGGAPPILLAMQGVQWYYGLIQLILVFVALFGVVRKFVDTKAIAARPHWTTYKTKRDFSRKH